jgi:hypothetical protein
MEDMLPPAYEQNKSQNWLQRKINSHRLTGPDPFQQILAFSAWTSVTADLLSERCRLLWLR